MTKDQFFMQYAISLAEKARGNTSPNPLVGTVIVKDDKIVGTGYHREYGNPHAEAIAIEDAKSNLKDSTLYVTLEPCIHYGKTPPCVDKIIKTGIKKVVIGLQDPNPVISGKGIEKLRQNGITVITGVLKEQIKEQNKGYLKFHQHKKPFVTLKIAVSMDGKMATSDGKSKWISSKKSRIYTHYLRSINDAILVGAGTVLKDNPILTPRDYPFLKMPLRIVVDPQLKITYAMNVFNDDAKTILISSNDSPAGKIKLFKEKGIEIELMNTKNGIIEWEEILKKIAEKGILYLLVEGGAFVSSTLIEQEEVDQLILIYSPTLIGKGISFTDYMKTGKIKQFKVEILKEYKIEKDKILWCNVYRNS